MMVAGAADTAVSGADIKLLRDSRRPLAAAAGDRPKEEPAQNSDSTRHPFSMLPTPRPRAHKGTAVSFTADILAR